MPGIDVALSTVQFFWKQIRRGITLIFRGWNLLLVKFVASDIHASVVDRTDGTRTIPFTRLPARHRPVETVEDDDRPQIRLNADAKELLWVSVQYDGPLSFDSIRWWVKFPNGYRILRACDAESETLPPLGSTQYHDDEGVLINPNEGPLYQNLARSPTSDKRFHVIERNVVRWELERYASGQTAIVPIWVDTPPSDAGDHRVEIEIDPPNTPLSVTKVLDIELR